MKVAKGAMEGTKETMGNKRGEKIMGERKEMIGNEKNNRE
jgi:hypothetical protein